MINYIYTIHDKVLKDSGPVLEARNDDVAIRQFKMVMKSSQNPQDFELYCIGLYNSIEPAIESVEKKLIATGHDMIHLIIKEEKDKKENENNGTNE